MAATTWYDVYCLGVPSFSLVGCKNMVGFPRVDFRGRENLVIWMDRTHRVVRSIYIAHPFVAWCVVTKPPRHEREWGRLNKVGRCFEHVKPLC